MDPVDRPPRTAARTLTEGLALARLLLWPTRGRSDAVYRLLGTHNHLGERSLYLNLGYWARAATYDDACAALVDELAEHALLQPGLDLLDVGCGYGDQDQRLAERYAPASLVAINTSAPQLELARRRVTHPAVRFVRASATALPVPDRAVDRVLALESAFHVAPRTAFFAEALRVLRPGGWLALADPVPRRAPEGAVGWARAWAEGAFWQVPLANQVTPETYARQLVDAGFVDVTVRDVSEHVWAPFKAYARRRVHDPEVRARLHPLIARAWTAEHGSAAKLAYLLVRARRPEAA